MNTRTHASRRICCTAALVLATLLALGATAAGQDAQRARDLGVPFEGTPGPLNAITDVAGIEVGHHTIIRGEGELVVGEGPVRTGVTAVLPRGRASRGRVFAAWFTLNGNGEMTGTTWMRDRGILEGAVMITNTHSVAPSMRPPSPGRRRTSTRRTGACPSLPRPGRFPERHQRLSRPAGARLRRARLGPGRSGRGRLGGRRDRDAHVRLQGGDRDLFRIVEAGGNEYVVGVLVQSNFGSRNLMTIAGVPVGAGDPGPDAGARPVRHPRDDDDAAGDDDYGRDGSIIIVAATDAPLLPHQLNRFIRRTSLALGRVGSISSNGSGDIFVAFSTANQEAAHNESGIAPLENLANNNINSLFEGVVQATEEAIINALVAGRDIVGVNGRKIYGLPHDRLRDILRRYNRLSEPE